MNILLKILFKILSVISLLLSIIPLWHALAHAGAVAIVLLAAYQGQVEYPPISSLVTETLTALVLFGMASFFLICGWKGLRA